MDKQYKPEQFEDKIYQAWEKSGAFKPKDKGEPYCIIMPPPNANDPLHIGHAMFVTVEDLFVRYQRMQDKAVLWLPGTDHAGIETQYVFEKKLAKEGKSRFDFDRETLFNLIWDYVQENSGITVKQMKKLGASADWSRLKFSLDEDIKELVIETFIKMYKEGLVYREIRPVNFCTKCGTAFSNLEIKHVERKTELYYMTYGPFVLATTRPETKFGDTGIAVNPDDKRYAKWIGKEVEVEGFGQGPTGGKVKMRVIGDKYVDPKFGTGVVKITPAHDLNDFEVWQRHKDEIPGPKQVIGLNGRMNEKAGRFKGLKVLEARQQVVAELKQKGWLKKVDNNYEHTVGVCYRCGTVIEPIPLPQFFIKVKPLTEKVLKALKDKKVKIYGAGYEKILKHWLTNLNDWNISRQIVWGIRMPVWYKKGKKDDYVVAKEQPGKDYVQETDTFDTWFSSAQWPYVTLMTNQAEDFKRFYPSAVMETAYDILIFWVMRMLMMGLFLTGKVPFEKVYLHGLIRDEKGQKMSKSKGNVMNPLEVIEKYGADALRMALIMGSTAGKDKAVGEGMIRGMRNLTNKIWNAARFVRLQGKNSKVAKGDKQFKQKLKQVGKQITKQIEEMKPGLAAETAYNQFWHWYCDKCIEEAKQGKISQQALVEGLRIWLKLLHPFVPFVTETVWQQLPKTKEKLLINSRWPS